ncbi:MAG: protein of unknown function DUF2523 [Inoviridae sp.]|nr:MAG: protein of unknown function DUF2523 [Inoviridae sp.]
MALPLAGLLFPTVARFLASVVSGLVFRALVSLGFAYATFTGMNFLVDKVKAEVVSLFGSLPPQILGILGLAKIDIAINIIISAIVARLLLSGMDKVTGTITTMALIGKGPG